MDKILRNTNIWDLHIHTPLGTPTKKNYGNASTEEFVDAIIDIYNKSNNKIGMISFTDHNKINADCYCLERRNPVSTLTDLFLELHGLCIMQINR